MSSMYGAMEESTPVEAPALAPAELKAVRKLLSTSSSIGGSDVPRCDDREHRELGRRRLLGSIRFRADSSERLGLQVLRARFDAARFVTRAYSYSYVNEAATPTATLAPTGG